MPALKLANSGVDSNRLRLKRVVCAGPGPRALVSRLSAMRHLAVFPDKLLVGQAASDDLAHSYNEPLNVGHVTVVIAEHLFV